MKRSAILVFFLFSLVAVPLFAIRITSVGDVIRLHDSGATHAFILAAIERSSGQFEVTADDIVAMNRAGLSQELVEAVIDAGKPRPATPAGPAAPEPDAIQADDPEAEQEGADWTFDPPIYLFPPGWVIPRWLWDPHWAMPTLYKPASGGTERADTSTSVARAPRERANAAPRTAPAGESQPERSVARPPLERAAQATATGQHPHR